MRLRQQLVDESSRAIFHVVVPRNESDVLVRALETREEFLAWVLLRNDTPKRYPRLTTILSKRAISCANRAETRRTASGPSPALEDVGTKLEAAVLSAIEKNKDADDTATAIHLGRIALATLATGSGLRRDEMRIGEN